MSEINQLKGDYSVGCRIEDTDGHRATIRYIGIVAASKNKQEFWLGVEWDEQTRGKHDGSCVENGILYKYFDCKMGAGSFIKESKVRPRKSFVEALQERYVTLNASEITSADSTLPGMFVSTTKGNQKAIEFVGEKKLRKWQQISTIDKVMIRNDSIATAGNQVNEIASHLIEVDLQDNLLWSWKEIFSLVIQMNSLQSLLLQGNKLQPFNLEIANNHHLFPKNALSNLLRLALNNTGIKSWSSVTLLEQYLPNIEELYLAESDFWDMPYIDCSSVENENENENEIHSDNTTTSDIVINIENKSIDESTSPSSITSSITSSSPYVTGFKNLKILDMTSCNIDDWSKVLSLAKLPSLQQLILDYNPFSCLLSTNKHPASHSNTNSNNNTDFTELNRISIMSTKINSWNDIILLSEFPNLTNLRCSHIPLFVGMGSSEVRPLVIGRLAKLRFFNGSIVSIRERRDAEKTYLRSVMKLLTVSNATPSSSSSSSSIIYDTKEILIQHPRYEELKLQYGDEITPSSASETGIKNLAADLINITFQCVSVSAIASSTGSNLNIQKKLPSSLSIARLRVMLKQLYGIDPEFQQLAIRIDKDSIPTILDDDESSLAYYGAIDGSEIFVNEKD